MAFKDHQKSICYSITCPAIAACLWEGRRKFNSQHSGNIISIYHQCTTMSWHLQEFKEKKLSPLCNEESLLKKDKRRRHDRLSFWRLHCTNENILTGFRRIIYLRSHTSNEICGSENKSTCDWQTPCKMPPTKFFKRIRKRRLLGRS